MNDNRTRATLPVSTALVALIVAASGAGCTATRSSLEKQVEDLQREVTRLQSERANLASRNAALDDELLVLEKKKSCDRSSDSRAGLEVVRLRPQQEDRGSVNEDRISFAPAVEEPRKKEDGKRPVLTLVGSSPRGVSSVASRVDYDRSVPLTGQGDNLGVVRGESAQGPVPKTGPMSEFHEAYRDYSNRSYAKALAGFSGFLAANSEHAYADNAMFWIGECLLAQGKLLKAVGQYERVLRRYPRSEKGPSALYRIGFAYDKMNDRSKASEYYFKVVELHPGTDAARRASRRMAAIREAGSPGAGLIPTSARR